MNLEGYVFQYKALVKAATRCKCYQHQCLQGEGLLIQRTCVIQQIWGSK